MSPHTIHRQDDLSKFGKAYWNRPLSPKHVKNLVQSISSENRLDLKPIIVNERLEIIDGQHRVAAAKILNVPIYYIQKEIADDDPYVLRANSLQQKTQMADSVKFYANAGGNLTYKFIEEMMKKTGLQVGACLSLMGSPIKKTNAKKVHEGKITLFHSKEKIKEITDKYLDIKYIISSTDNSIVKCVIKINPFCKALHNFIKLDVNWDHFINRFTRDWDEMVVFFKKPEDYLEKFKKIYGKHCSKNKFD